MSTPSVRTVRFNDLPRSTRDRFIIATTQPKGAGADKPIRAETVSPGARVFGWIFLGLCGLGLVAMMWKNGYGSMYGRGIQDPGYLLWYALGTFTLLFSGVAAVYRHLLSKSLPYKEGRYLFPFDLVTAEKDTLIITPMSMLKGVRIVEHYKNGVYQHTAFHMDLTNGKTETFTMGKMDPDVVKNALDGARAEIRKALESADLKRLEELDLFFALDQKKEGAAATEEEKKDLFGLGAEAGNKTQGLPDWWRHRLVGAAALALVLTPILWKVRNNGSDDAMWENATRRDRVEDLESYLRYGKRHIKEAKERVYPVAYEEAVTKKSAAALREMIRKYPDSPFVGKAREGIHALIQASWEKFKARAGEGADPKMLGFIERLLGYLEKNDTSTVSVRFQPPETALLRELDAELTKKNIAPVSAHFSASASRDREGIITTALQRGFGAIFPNDILKFERGGLYEKKPTAPPPTMEIRYTVEPTDSVYKGKSDLRGFVGIRVGFDLALRIPGDPEVLPIALSVLPPQRFTVSYSTYRPKYSAPRPGDGPSDSQVYAVMAERAFDQFASKLAQIFFNIAPKEPLPPSPPPQLNPAAPAAPPAPPPPVETGAKKKKKRAK